VAAQPAQDCTAAIARAEVEQDIPRSLLYAIAVTESGRRTQDGGLSPWPWTLNVDGKGLYVDSQQEAVALAERLLGQGARNIDLGCLQISSQYHPRAFTSLYEAFTPAANARYAARLLRSLYQRLGSWERAVAHYHSANPERGAAYQQRVYAAYGGDLRPALSEAVQRERLQGPVLEATRLLRQNPAAAVSAFSAILQTQPDDPLALAGRALALQRSGDDDAAYGDLLRLYQQTPDDRQVWQKLSRALSSQPTELRIQRLEMLAAHHPQDRRIRDWLVRDSLAAGDDARAFRHKMAMVDLSPTEPRLYFDAATIAERLGHVVDALDLCDAALSLPTLAPQDALRDHLTACANRARSQLLQRSQETDGLSLH
jgi:Flp pilus assembly protein TadD